jgi:hypothetical protein
VVDGVEDGLVVSDNVVVVEPDGVGVVVRDGVKVAVMMVLGEDEGENEAVAVVEGVAVRDMYRCQNFM